MNNITQPITDGFIDGMRLAKTLVLLPVVAVVVGWYVVSAFVHHRTFRVSDAITAVRGAALHG